MAIDLTKEMQTDEAIGLAIDLLTERCSETDTASPEGHLARLALAEMEALRRSYAAALSELGRLIADAKAEQVELNEGGSDDDDSDDDDARNEAAIRAETREWTARAILKTLKGA